MREAGREPNVAGSVDIEAEDARIAALEAARAGLDRGRWDAREKVFRELFEVRGRRIDRRNERNWEKLEQLVGHKIER